MRSRGVPGAIRARATRPRPPWGWLVPLVLVAVLAQTGTAALLWRAGTDRQAGAPVVTPSAPASSSPRAGAAPAPATPTTAGRASPRTGNQPTPRRTGSRAAQQALDALLAARSAAVLARDPGAFLATVDPAANRFASDQRELFATLRQLPVATWTYAPSSAGPPLSAVRQQQLGPAAWVARVVLHYRLAGFDEADVVREQFLTVVPIGDGWRLAGDTDAPDVSRARDLWDLGPVTVARGAASLVVARGADRDLGRYVREADTAVRQVTDVWPDGWVRRVVLLVPESQHEMSAVLDSPAAGLEQIAAVTTGQVASGTRSTAGDRVVVNPDTFRTLTETGRQVVLSHESTHVATRASSAKPVPLWLSEGFADYVGYRSSEVPVSVAARDLLAQVRDGQGPGQLPGSADFAATSPDLSAAYESAWLACRLLAERYGQDRLVAFYRAVGATGDTGLAAAFASVLGTTQKQFVAAWHASLQAQAHG